MSPFTLSFRRNPLVPAAILFLPAVALGIQVPLPAHVLLVAAILSWLAWVIAERFFTSSTLSHATFALTIVFAAIALGTLNQHHVGATDIARFARDEQLPITAQVRVLTPPEELSTHGNSYFLASATQIFTDRGWISSSGDVRIKWHADANSPDLHRGDLVEIYGWLKRPDPALNPGGFDSRRILAADRIFSEIRVPRPSGLVPLHSTTARPNLLTHIRLFLRAKLLAHTVDVDTEAGYSMVALLLGHRDPAIDSVSQSFADAGVAHLLAISGSHIVFFTAMIWLLLRFIPMRPQWREPLIAAIVMLYVLATPCGPPVVRAAIALLMVLLARLMGRPRMLMNMLSAAAIIVVLLRPADLLDAGSQLSFICTAGLILFAERLYTMLSGRIVMREELIADLANTRLARVRLRVVQYLFAIVTANLIGGAIAVPLVAFHFGRVNLYGVVGGLVATPFVAATMAGSALQLLLELLLPSVAALTAPLATWLARWMLGTVGLLAHVPGAALALRPPPAWLVVLLYVPFVLWGIRRWLGVRRATVVNVAVAAVTVAAGWYAFTQPRGELKVQALSVGQGSAALIRMPSGELFLVNAGSRDTPNVIGRALAPAMRLAGTQRLDGLLLTSLTTPSAQSAANVIEQFRPSMVFTSAIEWERRNWTFAGASVEDAMANAAIRRATLRSGATIPSGNATLRVLWPAEKIEPPTPASLILLAEYRGRRILLMEPGAGDALGIVMFNHQQLRANAVILLGPEPGAARAAPVKELLARLGVRTVVWSGRTPWSGRSGDLNTAFGWVELTVGADGKVQRQK
jgi:competence protein ComEC